MATSVPSRFLATMVIFALAVGQCRSSTSADFQGVVVGNFSANPLCQAFPMGLSAIRSVCGFNSSTLFPALGHPEIVNRDFASLGSGLAGLHRSLVADYGQACGDAAFKHACRQYIPRCDSSSTDVVWSPAETTQECQDMQSACGAMNYSTIQMNNRLCTTEFLIAGTFKIAECRMPDTTLMAPECASRSHSMPTYYQQLYSKADQQSVKAAVATMEANNVSQSCQDSYFDVACLPGFACGSGAPTNDPILRDLRPREKCEAAEACLRAANVTSVRLPATCSDLANSSRSSASTVYAKVYELGIAVTLAAFATLFRH